MIMTVEGENPQLPSIMLNSHTDVVPAYTEHWECDPFAAVKKENGDIVARGTQVGVVFTSGLLSIINWYLSSHPGHEVLWYVVFGGHA